MGVDRMPKKREKKKEEKKESSNQHSNRSLYIVLLVAAIAIATLSYYTYNGLFEPTVKYSSVEMGNLYSNFMGPGDDDYTLYVKYSSRGAFIAGRKINVSVDLAITDRLAGNSTAMKELENATFMILFPGSTPYSLPKGLPASSISADVPSSSDLDGVVELHLDNKSYAHGETELVYFMPESNGEPAVAPFVTNGKYTYTLLIANDKGHILHFQNSDKMSRRNSFLFIAPLETALTLTNGNLILILTFVAIYVAIIQIAIELQRRARK